MGVYGDMLSFFPELRRVFSNFEMKVKLVSGYEPRINERKVTGVLQYKKAGSLDIEGDNLADTDVPVFYTRIECKKGSFLSDLNNVYRISKDNKWYFEGGFYCYVLEKVIGTTDTQTTNTKVDLGKSKYD